MSWSEEDLIKRFPYRVRLKISGGLAPRDVVKFFRENLDMIIIKHDRVPYQDYAFVTYGFSEQELATIFQLKFGHYI